MGDQEREQWRWEQLVLIGLMEMLRELDPDVVLTILDSWPLPSDL